MRIVHTRNCGQHMSAIDQNAFAERALATATGRIGVLQHCNPRMITARSDATAQRCVRSQ